MKKIFKYLTIFSSVLVALALILLIVLGLYIWITPLGTLIDATCPHFMMWSSVKMVSMDGFKEYPIIKPIVALDELYDPQQLSICDPGKSRLLSENLLEQCDDANTIHLLTNRENSSFRLLIEARPEAGNSLSQKYGCYEEEIEKTKVRLYDGDGKLLKEQYGKHKPSEDGYTSLDFEVEANVPENQTYVVELSKGWLFKDKLQRTIKFSWLGDEEFEKEKQLIK